MASERHDVDKYLITKIETTQKDNTTTHLARKISRCDLGIAFDGHGAKMR